MTLGLQVALDWSGVGEILGMVWLQPWGEGEQEHCEVSMGVMEDTGPQVPTPTRPPRLPHLPSPSGPPRPPVPICSWLQPGPLSPAAT